MPGLMHARRVDEHDLAAGTVNDALYAVPRSLRFVGNSRDLFADEAIQKRGFSGIWPADERDIAASKTFR